MDRFQRRDVLMPKNITKSALSEGVRKINFMYDCLEKRIPFVSIKFPQMKDVDLLGMLFIYEFMAYSVQYNCFSNPRCVNAKFLGNFVGKYGFKDLILNCFQDSKKDKLEKAYNNLTGKKDESFAFYPIQLKPSGNIETSEKSTIAMSAISEFYSNENVPEESLSMIDTIFIELVDNFYSHADDKTNSLIVLYGTKDYIHIACADCGLGIAGSFEQSCKNEQRFIADAFNKGITSKPDSNHMGQGLWIIKESIKRNGGTLLVYSQHTSYSIRNGREKYGVVPYWKGTMIDVMLNVRKPVIISDFCKEL